MKTNRWTLIMIAAAVSCIVGCQKKGAASLEQEALTDSIVVLQEEARMGDSTAYLRLAALWLQDENVERGTLQALAMASQAEEWGAVASWYDWALSMPKYLAVHHVAEVLQDVSYHRFAEARAKSKRLTNMGLHPDWIETMIAMEKNQKEKAVSMSQQMIADGSLMGRTLYCLVTEDKDSLLSLAEELPIIYVFLAEKAHREEHGKDPDEISENVPRYYLKADSNACLNREGARILLGYYQHLLFHDSLAVSPEELRRMEGLAKKGAPTERAEEEA